MSLDGGGMSAWSQPRKAWPPLARMETLRLVPAAETAARPPLARPLTLPDAVIVVSPSVEAAVSTNTSPLLAARLSVPLVAVALVRLMPVDDTSTLEPVTLALPVAETAPR